MDLAQVVGERANNFELRLREIAEAHDWLKAE
jgi:hypothetical protein